MGTLKTPAKRAPNGRPRFEPTDHLRGLVQGMAQVGTPQPEIARALGVDAKTLRRHFRDEIEVSRIKAVAQVKQGLFAAATGWMKPGPDGRVTGAPTREAVTAAIFICKTMGGMSERLTLDGEVAAKHEHKHSGEIAARVDVAPAAVLESARLLDDLARRLAGGAVPAAGLAGDGAAEPAPPA